MSDDQLAYLDAAENFSASEFAPYAAEWDANKVFPEAALRSAAELGFGGRQDSFVGHAVSHDSVVNCATA